MCYQFKNKDDQIVFELKLRILLLLFTLSLSSLVASDLAIKKYELEAISSIVEDGKLAIYFYTFRIQVCLMKNHELLSKITLC